MKKTILMIFVLSSALFFAFPTMAVSPFRENIRTGSDDNLTVTPRPTGLFKDLKNTLRESSGEGNTDVLDKVKNFVKKNFKFGARITGTIATIGTGSITVTGNDGKTYTVNITSTTKLVRRFGGASSLSEFSVGDAVNVFGSFTDTTNTTINAYLIRDSSIQKRWGAFFGKVTQKNVDNFVVQTVERGVQTVYFGSAKFIERNETAMTYSDMNVGDRVRVKGVWDRTTNKITEVGEVKDFSLPPLPTKTVTPTPTPTPTP